MVTLYTTHCPRCQVLAAKMDNAGIKYEVCDDVDVMTQKGFMSVPLLEIDEKVLQFKEAIDWVNNGGQKN